MAADFVAGLNGGLAGTIAVYPLDTVKTRLQAQSGSIPRYKGAIHCLVSIAKQESFRGLFKGMASPALCASTLNSVLFGTFGICIRYLDSERLSHHFLAGCVAGLVQSPLSCAVELTKVRVQMQGVGEMTGQVKNRHYSGSINALFKIMKYDGVQGCLRGMRITVARDIPGFGVYFLCYEGLRRVLTDPETKHTGLVPLMCAGGLGGMMSFVVIYPLDVVKTRYQIDGVSNSCRYSSYGDVIREIYRQRGLRGFSAGISITLIRTFPCNAAIFGAVALTRRTFDIFTH